MMLSMWDLLTMKALMGLSPGPPAAASWAAWCRPYRASHPQGRNGGETPERLRERGRAGTTRQSRGRYE